MRRRRPQKHFFGTIPLAWFQLTSNKVRFIVAVLGVAFAGMSVFMQLAFQDSLYDSQTSVHQLLKADLIVFNAEMQSLHRPFSFPRQHLYRLLNYSGVSSVNTLHAAQRAFRNADLPTGVAITFFGVNPAQVPFEFASPPPSFSELNLTGVAWLSDKSDLKSFGATGDALLNGETVRAELGGKKIHVRRLADFAGASFVDEGNILLGLPTFLQVVSEQSAEEVTLGLITLEPGANLAAVKQTLRSQLPEKLHLMTQQEFIDYEKDYWAKAAPIGFILKMGVFVSFSVGVIIVYQILYNEVSDHLPDYAVLKARGFKHRYFLNILFQEALLLALTGYIPGVLLSLLLYEITRNATALPMTMTPERATFVFVVSLAICFTSGAISMAKLREADPADLF
ncbi:MAG: ABC transporter permease DevC [Cyanobacteria bacterium J06648_16]